MKQKNLDLTFVKICNEKAEIPRRNQKAQEYINQKAQQYINRETRLEKAMNKILSIAFTMVVILIALCVVEYVHYEVFCTLF